MIYGVAIHKYCDTMFKTRGDIKAAKAAAVKAFSTPKHYDKRSPHLADEKHMLSVAIMYFENYLKCDQQFDMIELDGKISSEMTFSYRIYEDDFMMVDLEGTSDGVGKIRGGCYAIRDLKCTSAWDKDSFLFKYELDRQLRIYRLALTLAHEKAPDSILGQIGGQQVGGFIDAIFLKPTITEVKYERSAVYQFSTFDIEEIRTSLVMLLRRYSLELQQALGSGKEIFREGILNGACTSGKYMCAFRNICKQAENPVIVKALLEKDFIKKDFQPLHYND